jgi:hypothetical protein
MTDVDANIVPFISGHFEAEGASLDGRVGVWRGGYRSSISVCRPFRLAVP